MSIGRADFPASRVTPSAQIARKRRVPPDTEDLPSQRVPGRDPVCDRRARNQPGSQRSGWGLRTDIVDGRPLLQANSRGAGIGNASTSPRSRPAGGSPAIPPSRAAAAGKRERRRRKAIGAVAAMTTPAGTADNSRIREVVVSGTSPIQKSAQISVNLRPISDAPRPSLSYRSQRSRRQAPSAVPMWMVSAGCGPTAIERAPRVPRPSLQRCQEPKIPPWRLR